MGAGDSEGEAGIGALEGACETEFDLRKLWEGCHQCELCGNLGSPPLQHGKRSGRLWGSEARSGLLHNSRFVPGDLLDCIAEDCGVIDAQGGDGGDCWANKDVGGVILSTHTAFNNGSIDAFGEVGVEGHECEKAEVGRFGSQIWGLRALASRRFESIPRLKEVFGKFVFREGLIVDLDPFTDEA